MKQIAFLCAMLLTCSIQAETYVYFQNNTSLTFSLGAVQSGTHTLSAGEWGFSTDSIQPWQINLGTPGTELLWTNRDQGIHNGDDFYFDINLGNGGNTITLKVQLNGNFVGSDLSQSASGPGFSHAWFSDSNFHEETFTMGGKTYTLKYTAYFTGGYDDILYSLQEHDPFPVNPADLSDPNVLNVLAYNLYMLPPPIAFTDQEERAAEIPNHIHDYDVIVFSEAFYNSARDNDLIPGIIGEYPYMTPVVDEGTFNEDGGVFIASRWPIDTFEQIVYDDCDGSDCLSAKGVMYARINKLGKTYHVFGSHLQAWNDPQNTVTRAAQFQQFLGFLGSLNIPKEEPVVLAGDLNVDKYVNLLGEYDGMLDSLNALEPTYTGHPYTYNFGLNHYGTSGLEFLDYALPLKDYFTPYEAINHTIILRSIADDVWDIFDLSDHFGIHGRFVYPYITDQPDAQSLCEGEQLVLHAELSINTTYQWYQDGQAIAGATTDSLIIPTVSASDLGDYFCVLTYNNGSINSDTVFVAVLPQPNSPVITQSNDTLFSSSPTGNQWQDANGVIAGATDNFYVPTASGMYYATVDSGSCTSNLSAGYNYNILSIENPMFSDFQLFPNPVKDILFLTFSEQKSYHLVIYAADGRQIHRTVIEQKKAELDLSGFPSGLYWLRLEDGTGEAIVKRLIKK